MKGLSILALMIAAIACVMAQEEPIDAAMLAVADETAVVDDKAASDADFKCANCHPHCPPSCVKPPHHHYNHHHHPYQCPTCPPRPTCPTCPPVTCPPVTCPPTTCPPCSTCPTQPPCPTCPTKPTCPPCPTKPPHCYHPHPTLIGVCLDLDLGIGK